MSRQSVAALLLFSLSLFCSSCCHCPTSTPCITFEAPLVVGTQYGTPVGQAPGAVAFTSSGIPVILQKFTAVNGSTFFNLAQIDVAPRPFGSGQSLRLNNIDVEFDFSAVAPVNGVTLQFLDLGGSEDLSINGSAPHVGEIGAAPASIGGVSVAVTTTPVAGGRIGTLTLTGPIKTLRIGGQEFWIDDVCVK